MADGVKWVRGRSLLHTLGVTEIGALREEGTDKVFRPEDFVAGDVVDYGRERELTVKESGLKLRVSEFFWRLWSCGELEGQMRDARLEEYEEYTWVQEVTCGDA